MTKLLLLRPGALGDLLLTVPALRAIRSQMAVAHVTLVGHSEAVSLLHDSSLIDVGLSQDDSRLLGLFSTDGTPLHELRLLGGFDIAVAWMTDPERMVEVNLQRLGPRQIIVASAAPRDSSTHAADHLLATLSPLGLTAPSSIDWSLALPSDAQAWAQERLSALVPSDSPLIAVHPGSGGARKNWLAASFGATIDALTDQGLTTILLCGPADEKVVEAVLSTLKTPVLVSRDLTLPRLAALLARSCAYLGNDSGVTHLAGLTGTPTFALFGPTNPIVWAPRGARVTILRWQDERGELTPERVALAIRRAITLPNTST